MEPKKKNIMDIILPCIAVVVVVFLALHMAMAVDIMKNTQLEEGQAELFVLVGAFFTNLSEQPFKLAWGPYSLKFLAGALFISLIIIAYFVVSKKNYINDKEYGTSAWGTSSQIAHLQASAVKKQEKKRALKEKAGAKELAEIEKKYTDNSNIIFTKTEKICMYNYELNNNTLIIGGSGSGKTRGYVLPNILQCCNSEYSPSIVCTDPKGEILEKIGKYLDENGYEIRVLNLKEQERSFCFNPFKYINKKRYEEQISSLVSCIMDSRSEKAENKSSDPFWEDMAKVLLKAIFYAAYEGFPAEEQNMGTVMGLFRWFEVSDNDDRYDNPTKLDIFFELLGDKYGVSDVVNAVIDYSAMLQHESHEEISLEMYSDVDDLKYRVAIPLGSSAAGYAESLKEEIIRTAHGMEERFGQNEELEMQAQAAIDALNKYIEDRAQNYPNGDKPVGVSVYEEFGDENTNAALRNWEDFRTKCKGKTAQSVTATVLSKLSPFDEEQLRRIFSKDEMELDLVGERKTALFIILPPTNKNYNFVANVLYTQLFEQLEYCATVKHDQKLPVPVRFILDEFYNTGKIANFENILSYARSFGIGISILVQSLEQIKEMYEKSWGTVLDNCSTFLYLGGIRHFDTLKYISDLLGKGTFDKKTYSYSKGRQSSTSTSFDKIGRELLDPSEIQRLKKDKCLLFVSGYQPYMSQKFNYKSHKNYKYTSDADKRNSYQYKVPEEF